MATASPASPRGLHRYEVPIAAADRDVLTARLWAAGAIGVWELPDHLVAWYPDRAAPVPAGGIWSAEPERDWQAEWKATIQPVCAGRFSIVPSWLADDHQPVPGEITLVLDPGRAFGTGHHATTTLCLELLDGLDVAGRVVADVGCGTGVLAIAAARLGADPVAVDLDADAIAVARANAARNGVEVELRVGSVEVLPGPADVVVANLLTDVVVVLADRLAAATRSHLIVSGVATERRLDVEDAITATGLDVVEVRERDGWVALQASRRRG